jgi:hypothetical protein
MGEETGWLISPMLEGFYHDYVATGDAYWIDQMGDRPDARVSRGGVEPDGYIG